MRTIDRPGSFKRDYKRETKGQHRATLDSELLPVFKALATDQPLAPRYRDHDLTGDCINWGLTPIVFPYATSEQVQRGPGFCDYAQNDEIAGQARNDGGARNDERMHAAPSPCAQVAGSRQPLDSRYWVRAAQFYFAGALGTG